jgi:serine protease Do
VDTKSSAKPPRGRVGFIRGAFIPFVCGILGIILVVVLYAKVPLVNEKTNEFLNISSTNKSLEKTEKTNEKTEEKTTEVTSKPVSLEDYSQASMYAAEKVLPSVVGITVEYTVNSPYYGFTISQNASARGSGVIISQDGYILTNNHVVNTSSNSSFYQVSQANKITVKLYKSDEAIEAKLIGTDEKTDLAVIKIDKEDLPAATLGDSDSLKIGEFAMAVGNPLGMESTVTAGIVSALSRTITVDNVTYHVLQTDAAINSGNSGGALVNSKGEVIGINTLKLSSGEGIGFAIPINSTKEIANQLIAEGKVKRPFIGITGREIDEETAKKYNLVEGIYLLTIEEFSAAEKANLKVADIITEFDGKPVKTMDEINEIKNSHAIGDTVKVKVYRNGETIELDLVLGEE